MNSTHTDESINKAIKRIKEISEKYPNDANSLKENVYKLLCLLVNPSQSNAQADPSIAQALAAPFDFPRSQNETERKKIDERLRGFSLNDSIAWKGICERFGPNLNQSELLSIAEVLCSEVNHSDRNVQLKVDREAKRRKEEGKKI